MNIDRITYSKIFPTSAFMNERVGVEIALNPGDDAMEALRTAKQLCQDFNKESNPELYKHNEKPLTAEETSLLEDIKNAVDLKKLGLVKNHLTPALQPYYMERMKALTNNYSTHD
jgi:hypothetical protein